VTYIMVFLGALISSLLITPTIIRLAHKLNILDIPNPKNPGKIHKDPIALMGGLAIYLSILLISCIFLELSFKLVGIFISMTVLLALGIADDLRNLDYRFRLWVQFAVALAIIFILDIKIEFLADYPLIGYPLTLLWIIGVTNALNLMDNVDGATSGVSFLASAGLFIFAWINQDALSAVISLALAGSCLGFLYFNFKPASIFLGDTGSLLLGVTLATLALMETRYFSLSFNHALILPFVIGVPIFDTTLATLLRLYHRRPIYMADKSNLTYRLFEMGFSQVETVIIEYVMAVFFIGSGFLLWRSSPAQSLLIVLGVGSLAILFGLRCASAGKTEKKIATQRLVTSRARSRAHY